MRLFVATDIPADIRQALAEAGTKLKPAAPEARWVRPESLHLTLKFIGEQPEEKVASICAALRAAKTPGPFRLGLRGLHFFPEGRFPRVLAVFIHGETGHRKTAELVRLVDLQLAPLNIPREERAFRGHLTVARLDPGARHAALEAALADMMRREWGEFDVREFHLYRSELKRGGAVYTRLAAFPLGAPKS
jgi:2'-5' RNA ligase